MACVPITGAIRIVLTAALEVIFKLVTAIDFDKCGSEHGSPDVTLSCNLEGWSSLSRPYENT